ncbi:cation channel sperm-associated auxiliary subunit delta [Macrotis lagotis]|uniref:cation channel sperm-associated auxiliary subunit delta n=1 Tax=Macrotis lagotis TaxID=92651 RepID=UPI003D688CEE
MRPGRACSLSARQPAGPGRLPRPWSLAGLLALAVLGLPVLPAPNVTRKKTGVDRMLCSPKLIETGKSHYMIEMVDIEDVLFYAHPKPRIIKHPCIQRMALYLGKQLFLSTDNFQRSLIPLNIPKSFKVGIPIVTSAVYSSSNLLLAINGNIYCYEFADNLWKSLLQVDEYLTNIYAEYCCYGNDYSCLTISYLVLAYTYGKSIKQAKIYISRTKGMNFQPLDIPQLKEASGTLEAIFYFHSISKFAVLLKQGDVGKFLFLDSEGHLTWGVNFYMSGKLQFTDLPGLKGFLILWNEKHLLFSHNNGQLTEEIPIKMDNKITEENFNQSGNSISILAGYENELVLITTKNDFYYGTLGLLSTSIIKILEAPFVTEDSAVMFKSVGNIIITTPTKSTVFGAFDFIVCEVNMQLVLMNLEIGLKTCKAEVLRGDFDKKFLVLDMGKQLNLTAKLVPQPAQSPIPIITVSNPYALGFKAKMYEDGYTHDGNTKFTINITVMQQHVSGKAAKSFVSDIKISSLSTIMLDLVDRGMSCIDLQPPVGLISIGCNWNKRIQIRRELTACKRGFLKPLDLQRNYIYTLEKCSIMASAGPQLCPRPQPLSRCNKGCATGAQSICYALPPPQQLGAGEKTLKGSCKLSDFLMAEAPIWPNGVPDPQLIQNITAQVESYFSNESLAQDAFLLKHVQKSKLGFVSIKLLTSFKKVKHLTRDWRLTCYALRSSALLEVNEEGTKVRRRIPVPDWLLGLSHSKLLLVWEKAESRLPKESNTPKTSLTTAQPAGFLAAVSSLFGPCGALTSIRVLRPGKKLPPDVQAYTALYPELLYYPCALVQFESVEAAGQAFTTLQEDPRGFQVVRLIKKNHRRNGIGVEEGSTTLAPCTSSEAEGPKPTLSPLNLLGPLPTMASSWSWGPCPVLSLPRLVVSRLPHGPDGTRGFHHI